MKMPRGLRMPANMPTRGRERKVSQYPRMHSQQPRIVHACINSSKGSMLYHQRFRSINTALDVPSHPSLSTVNTPLYWRIHVWPGQPVERMSLRPPDQAGLRLSRMPQNQGPQFLLHTKI